MQLNEAQPRRGRRSTRRGRAEQGLDRTAHPGRAVGLCRRCQSGERFGCACSRGGRHLLCQTGQAWRDRQHLRRRVEWVRHGGRQPDRCRRGLRCRCRLARADQLRGHRVKGVGMNASHEDFVGRREDEPLFHGQGTFIDGLALPDLEGALHAHFVRSHRSPCPSAFGRCR